MSLLSYEIHEDVSNHHTCLEKLKTFANGLGWTVDDWRKQNCEWGWTGSQYDWLAGSETYLQLSSSGYGSQVLHYRFRGEAEGTDPSHEFIKLGSPDPTHTALDNALSTHPVDQYRWNSYTYHSYKPTNILKLWLFGLSSKWLSMVAQFDNFWVSMMGFGTLELFDTTETDGYHASDVGTGGDRWYNYDEWSFADRTYYNYFHDNRVKSNTDVKQSVGNQDTAFVRYDDLLLRNAYSEVRPMFKPVVIMKFDSDSLYRPVGQIPCYRIFHDGWSIGQKIIYGSKEFIVFPRNKINDSARYNGYAYRIT